MPNVANINRLIEILQKDSGIHFRMDGYVEYTPESGLPLHQRENPAKYLECQTAFCIAGWSNALRMIDAGKDYKNIVADTVGEFMMHFSNEDEACGWLDIGSADGETLFYLHSKRGPDKEDFDGISPEKRKIAGIRVLEILRDTGEVDWDTALVDAGIIKRGSEWE